MYHWSLEAVLVLVVSLTIIVRPFVIAIRLREPIFFWIGLLAFVWVGFTGIRRLQDLLN